MSWLLFMDESGHDHKNTPFEVRGGVAIHSSKIWPFIQDWQESLKKSFGVEFNDSGVEIKGSRLLDNKRIEWSKIMHPLSTAERHRGVNRFLTQKKQKLPLSQRSFAAYGQACKLMAREVFDLLEKHETALFASMIPRGVKKPKNFEFDHFLRKDQVFLQERFFNFLEAKHEHGLFVMDQTEKQEDKRFVKRLHNYYTKTQTGRSRTHWIVPTPIFVDSEMAPGVQAADVCLYCINWGFRLNHWGFTGQTRDDIRTEFGDRVAQLQFRGEAYNSDEGKSYPSYGIVHVPDPYTKRESQAD